MRTTLAVLLAVAAMVVAACSSTPAPDQIHAIGTSQAGVAIGSEKAGTPYVFLQRALCTTGGPVTIKSVRPYGASHMRVVAWAIRVRTPHSPWSLSDDKDGVRGVPTDNPGFKHQPVTVRCGPDPTKAVNDFALGVEFTGTRGSMLGVRIGYGAGQSTRSQFAIALCTTRQCAHAAPPN